MKSSLLSKLSDRDRDTSHTITSDESRPQRDVLTDKFIQLKNQEITKVSQEIFNHLSQINSDLKAHRKREIAKIKHVFSKHIFDQGSQYFTDNNSIGEYKFPQVVEDLKNSILTDLQIPEAAKFPEPIPTNLKNLVEKGLKLVKEIVNDDPPGHFLIANPGEIFNPENHEPVPSCEPSGQIVYTTYPGYCLNDRIIGESLKAFVFTQPNKQPEGQEEQPFENNQNHQQPNSIENEQQSPSNQQLKPTSNHQSPVPQTSENNQNNQQPNSIENQQQPASNQELNSTSNDQSPVPQTSENNQNNQQPNSIENQQQPASNQELNSTSNDQSPVPQTSENNQNNQQPSSIENQ